MYRSLSPSRSARCVASEYSARRACTATCRTAGWLGRGRERGASVSPPLPGPRGLAAHLSFKLQAMYLR